MLIDAKPFLQDKVTIVPIRHLDVAISPTALLSEPLVKLENVQGLLDEREFDLWSDLVSAKERKRLAETKFAICHRFKSAGHVGREEAESERLLRKVFLCLRLVQPIAEPFQFVQLASKLDSHDVLRFSGPEGEVSPLDADVWRVVGTAELEKVWHVLPALLEVAAGPPSNLSRAINLFHEGYYRTYQPAVQVVVWCMGIDCCLSPKRALVSKDRLKAIFREFPPETDIYKDLPWNLSNERRPSISLGEVAGPLFQFRNSLVHGLWDELPSTSISRKTMTGSEIGTADLLREAASFLLRTLILKALGPTSAS